MQLPSTARARHAAVGADTEQRVAGEMPRLPWCDALKFAGECGDCRPCRARQSTRDSRARKAGRFVPLRPLGRPVERCEVESVAMQRRDWRLDRPRGQKRCKVTRGTASPRRLTVSLSTGAVEARPAGRMGQGLFATRPVKSGEHLCIYEGRYYGSKEALDASRRSRGLPVSTAALKIMDGTNRYIDGDDPAYLSTPGRAANHSTFANAKYEEIQGSCILVAMQTIATDQQVFIDYGPDYQPVREIRSRSVF
eukprot:COSAG02_NODE_6769_length_3370_cov_3.892999_1_plen_252_part_00